MVIGKPAHLQRSERLLWRCGSGWQFGQASTLVDGRMHYQDARRLIGDQLDHAFDRDLLLFVVADKHAPRGGQARGKPQVVDKEREVANGEGLRGHGLGRQQQRDANSKGDGVIGDRGEQFSKQAVAQHGFTAHIVQGAEMADHVLFSVGDFHRLHRGEELSQETDDVTGRDAGGVTIAMNAAPGKARNDDGERQRQENDQGDPQIDAGHNDYSDQRGDGLPGHIGNPEREVRGLIDIVIVAADGVSHRDRRRQGTGAAQSAGEEVETQQRPRRVAEGHVAPYLTKGCRLPHQLDRDVEGDQFPQSNADRGRSRDAIEDRLLDETRYDLDNEKRHVKDAEHDVRPGPVTDELPVERPGFQGALLLSPL